jgi:RNA polymerase sigma-70 factor (ECF subfamily)
MTNTTTAIRTGYGILAVEPDTEADLIDRACAGDSEAFGRLYEKSVDRVYRYIYFRVTDDATAEDLTSAVFLKAWESLPRYKAGKSPFIAWLYTIAHNAVIDHYRTRKQTSALDEIASLPSSELPPDEQFDRLFGAQSLRQSLQKLTGPQRDVVTMRLIDGMGTEQVARRLRKSPGAIRALQMRALQALAKILKEEEPAHD